jgi:hypothetical protein
MPDDVALAAIARRAIEVEQANADGREVEPDPELPPIVAFMSMVQAPAEVRDWSFRPSAAVA